MTNTIATNPAEGCEARWDLARKLRALSAHVHEVVSLATGSLPSPSNLRRELGGMVTNYMLALQEHNRRNGGKDEPIRAVSDEYTGRRIWDGEPLAILDAINALIVASLAYLHGGRDAEWLSDWLLVDRFDGPACLPFREAS